jgi:hypothetical protein
MRSYYSQLFVQTKSLRSNGTTGTHTNAFPFSEIYMQYFFNVRKHSFFSICMDLYFHMLRTWKSYMLGGGLQIYVLNLSHKERGQDYHRGQAIRRGGPRAAWHLHWVQDLNRENFYQNNIYVHMLIIDIYIYIISFVHFLKKKQKKKRRRAAGDTGQPNWAAASRAARRGLGNHDIRSVRSCPKPQGFFF